MKEEVEVIEIKYEASELSGYTRLVYKGNFWVQTEGIFYFYIQE